MNDYDEEFQETCDLCGEDVTEFDLMEHDGLCGICYDEIEETNNVRQ